MPLDSNETDWIVQVNESLKLELMPSDKQQYWEKRSIYRVPTYITNLNRKAYWPQAVSFGPYHHGKVHLRPMEDHKRRALLHFLRRSRKPLEHFVESLREVAGDIEASYDALDPKWKEGDGKGVADRFLELMITDGCFLLEILKTMTGKVKDYASNDPIFGDLGWLYIVPYIMRDMLMLENQLPKLVLDRLVAVERDSEQEDEYTRRLIQIFFFPRMKIEKIEGKCLHILDVFRKSLLLQENKQVQPMFWLWRFWVSCFDGLQPNLNEVGGEDGKEIIRSATELEEAIIDVESLLPHEIMPEQVQPNLDEVGGEDGENLIRSATKLEEPNMDEVGGEDGENVEEPNQDEVGGEEGENLIRSATELEEAGIQLEKSKTGNLKDISFTGGVLRIPAIVVDDITESAFLNLMTFERFHHGAGNEVTAYIFFLDNIIDNEQDVALLNTRGIIKNLIGSNKAVANLFNSLNKDINLYTDNSLEAVREEVNKYCKKPWNKWRAHLIKTYFRSPWTILSLIAAIFLFALTIIQTIFIVFPDG